MNRLQGYVERYRELRAEILRLLQDDFAQNSSVLLMAHIPIPHFPSIYNAKRGRYSIVPRSISHNMALLDKFLTEIRQTLEANGTWESALVILSADHGKFDRALGHRTDRVPFLVKLPGQHENRTISEPVNTVITRALIDAVVEGRVQTADDLEAWVGNHRPSLASP